MRALVLILALHLPLHAEEDSDAARIGQLFHAAGVDGTFILYNLQAGTYTGHNADRWDSAYLPASTFKIFNALVALETGVIKDEHTVIPWDSTVHPREEWNRDHTLATGFKASTVWFYQELARRIGGVCMQRYLDSVGYGNRVMGGPIDRFWLGGGLRITPREQVGFLVRLYNDALPFAPEVMHTVKEIMIVEQAPGYILRAKTGYSGGRAPQAGWYVGYVERADGVYFFATELDIRKDEDVPKRVELSRKILGELGIIK